MTFDDSNLVEIISRALSRKHAVDALYVSSATVLFYDWLLILPLEVKHIWRSPWNWTKMVYFLTRYTSFVTVALMLRNQFASDATPKSCKNVIQAICWLSVMGINLAEIVLIVRTYAVWNKDKRVGIGLALLLGLFQIPCAIVEKRFIQMIQFTHNPHPQIYRGCMITGATRLVFTNWVAVVVLEGVVLALMIVSASKNYRDRTSNLLNVIYVGGIRFYLYIFCVTFANILVTLLLPIDFIGVGSSIEIVLHSNLTCRLMIELREAGQSYGHKPETFEPSGTGIEFATMNRHGSLSEGVLTNLESRAGPSRP